jgi:hypothetical protein
MIKAFCSRKATFLAFDCAKRKAVASGRSCSKGLSSISCDKQTNGNCRRARSSRLKIEEEANISGALISDLKKQASQVVADLFLTLPYSG